MEWSHAINAAERLGFSILLRNLDVEAISLPVYNRVVTIQTLEQAMLVAESIAAGRNAIYYDPQNLLDSAVIDKMVVLG
jgi:hypothetical protein